MRRVKFRAPASDIRYLHSKLLLLNNIVEKTVEMHVCNSETGVVQLADNIDQAAEITGVKITTIRKRIQHGTTRDIWGFKYTGDTEPWIFDRFKIDRVNEEPLILTSVKACCDELEMKVHKVDTLLKDNNAYGLEIGFTIAKHVVTIANEVTL